MLHDWYFIQASAVDPRARSMKFDDSLMGALVRFAAEHEVGHALGLAHNMGSSSLTPVENLRNKTWVETNGHTASIMDYARFNYVAQPEERSVLKVYTRVLVLTTNGQFTGVTKLFPIRQMLKMIKKLPTAGLSTASETIPGYGMV